MELLNAARHGLRAATARKSIRPANWPPQRGGVAPQPRGDPMPAAQSLRFSPLSTFPIFDHQTRHALKLAGVVGNQRKPICQSDRRDLNIIRPDWLAETGKRRAQLTA